MLRAMTVALLLVVTGALQAAPVRGEDIPLNIDGGGTPTDPKIAEVVRLIHVPYVPKSPLLEPINGPIVIDMQCTSRVYRSETSGFLTFETFWHAVEGSPFEGFDEQQTIGTVGDFSGFAINGFGIVDEGVRTEIITDSSGSNPGAASVGEGGSLSEPRFVLATNATRFDQNGTATAHGGDEALLHIIGTNQDKLDLIVGDMEVDHVFEPTAAIPLPAGAWPAGIVLALMFVVHRVHSASRKTPVVATVDSAGKLRRFSAVPI
jgi:hypothetical protein